MLIYLRYLLSLQTSPSLRLTYIRCGTLAGAMSGRADSYFVLYITSRPFAIVFCSIRSPEIMPHL